MRLSDKIACVNLPQSDDYPAPFLFPHVLSERYLTADRKKWHELFSRLTGPFCQLRGQAVRRRRWPGRGRNESGRTGVKSGTMRIGQCFRPRASHATGYRRDVLTRKFWWYLVGSDIASPKPRFRYQTAGLFGPCRSIEKGEFLQ